MNHRKRYRLVKYNSQHGGSSGKIVIVAPHNVCFNSTEQVCDQETGEMADTLKSLLDNQPIVIKSRQHRGILDDNRYSNHKTGLNIKMDSGLWRELRNTITGTNDMVISIHSFTKAFEDNEVALLDIKPFQKATISLHQHLNDNGIKCKIYEGKPGYNSILDVLSLHPLYVPSLLVEIRQGLGERRGVVLDTIARWVKMFFIEQ